MSGMSGPKYQVKIIRRNLQQAGDDYHMTVTRLSDDVSLVWISHWRWWLKFRSRRVAIDREFARYDKRKKKLADVEVFSR